MMMERLPPLAAVRVFEAVARHLNFTRAGEELGMSQSAVSYQMRVLEERIGTRLLDRSPRAVRLTAEGRRLAAPTQEAFDILRATYAPARHKARSLTVSAPASLAIQWLAPRLGLFQLGHPDLALRLLTDPAEGADDADAALRFAEDVRPGTASVPLFVPDFAPMWAPAFDPEGRIRHPGDLVDLPRLAAGDPAWTRWFDTQGVACPAGTLRPGVTFDAQPAEAAEALAGRAAVLLTPRLFRADIAAGRLRQPFPAVPLHPGRVWLVHRGRAAPPRPVRLFRDWLLAQVAEEDRFSGG
ncbi:LysR family transcriptional regulator [Rhodobacteraceae bacterium CCMM004]|nr:LysR family transcriptional regulator [Rhodobacteraceae bacterium CCMM004]